MGRPRFFFLGESSMWLSWGSVICCVRGMGGRVGGTVLGVVTMEGPSLCMVRHGGGGGVMEDTRKVPVKFSSRRSGSMGLFGNNVTVEEDETGVNEKETP